MRTAKRAALAVAVIWMLTPAHTCAGEESRREPVRLALMRGVPAKWNLERNFEAFLGLTAEAAEYKPDFFITPECWLDGYAAPDPASTRERLWQIAQDPSNSPYLERVAAEAKLRGMYICFGFSSIEDDRLYNAAGLWGPDGALIGIYHKTHIQTHDRQYDMGQSIPVWPTRHGPVGIMICADRRWPETARTLRLQGARLVLNPTYGFRGDLNEAMMRTRAYENQCFIAFTHPEQGLVTNPKGGVSAKKEGGKPAVLICDIDLSKAKNDDHLVDRRPDLYRVITEESSKP